MVTPEPLSHGPAGVFEELEEDVVQVLRNVGQRQVCQKEKRKRKKKKKTRSEDVVHVLRNVGQRQVCQKEKRKKEKNTIRRRSACAPECRATVGEN